MTTPSLDTQWEERMEVLCAELDDYGREEFLEVVDTLTAELPAGSAIALFERMAALDAGLTGERRRRATIQMASSLRNLGKPEEAVARYAQMLTDGPLDTARD